MIAKANFGTVTPSNLVRKHLRGGGVDDLADGLMHLLPLLELAGVLLLLLVLVVDQQLDGAERLLRLKKQILGFDS
jgi:hypothetical protein